ncbi:hypothetical protein SEA_STANIMAL_182 [Streptomyces phage Stanimal]|nr:hypothetical protein SEA_STANIMAL_182 [Streptomyces phage Stanimal]WNM73736.1 hypothetical protein SEA_SOLLERTIA_183 [Streptomyces phage Sollertia]
MIEINRVKLLVAKLKPYLPMALIWWKNRKNKAR